MSNVMHIEPVPGAPIACDMSAASDTLDERLLEYRRLYERALVRRERREDAVVFHFRAGGGTREAVEDLARREAACCPFLDYRVETVETEVIWTTTSPVAGDERASVDAILDAFHALPDHADSDIGRLFGRLTERGVDLPRLL